MQFYISMLSVQKHFLRKETLFCLFSEVLLEVFKLENKFL